MIKLTFQMLLSPKGVLSRRIGSPKGEDDCFQIELNTSLVSD